MSETMNNIEAIIPQREFIMTWWASFVIWVARDELIKLAGRSHGVKVYQGTLIMQFGDKAIKAKIV